MAKHREFNAGFGVVHVFDYPCGHSFNDIQSCPVCSSTDIANMWQARLEAHKAKLELRDRMLNECKEVFANLIEFDTISPEVKHELYGLMLKLDEIGKGMVNGKKAD